MALSVLKGPKVNGREDFGSVFGPVQFLIRKLLEHCSEHIVIMTGIKRWKCAASMYYLIANSNRLEQHFCNNNIPRYL